LPKTKVIFLCTHNSARSQIAEAFLRRDAGDHFEVYSAGYEPQLINPYAVKVMKEIGYDLADQYPKKLEQYLGTVHFGVVVTVCKKAEEHCPTIPGVAKRLDWSVEDPAAFEGSEEAKLAKFRAVRDQIDAQVKKWLMERGIPLNE
jgi:arsenate reductase